MVIALYVLVAFAAVDNLDLAQIGRDYALAVAARPFLGPAGFNLIGVAAVVSTASVINATLYGNSSGSWAGSCGVRCSSRARSGCGGDGPAIHPRRSHRDDRAVDLVVLPVNSSGVMRQGCGGRAG
ncbi:hypothetical protein [Mycobacterium servetii]|uniref:Uncharacterized protein n=1 Tax=Mycobacterium servetii TaxID=3237418 RepID=A0ABV4C062_9MYCO